MIDPANLHGKRIAMIAWAEKADGSDDVSVFAGTGNWDGKEFVLVREPSTSSLVLEPEWLERMKLVPDNLKDTLLGAEYQFSVSVGNIKDADNPEDLIKTGLKWPTEEAG